MAEFLSNASPEQLLMLMVLPVGGVLIFGGILFLGTPPQKEPHETGDDSKTIA
jgi:hypothetical protein